MKVSLLKNESIIIDEINLIAEFICDNFTREEFIEYFETEYIINNKRDDCSESTYTCAGQILDACFKETYSFSDKYKEAIKTYLQKTGEWDEALESGDLWCNGIGEAYDDDEDDREREWSIFTAYLSEIYLCKNLEKFVNIVNNQFDIKEKQINKIDLNQNI